MRWVLALLLTVTVAQAHDLTIVVGHKAGGGYDITARLLARHLPESVTVKNMPGAGGVKVVTWLCHQAPRDGSVIATFPAEVVTQAALRGEPYDPTQLSWIGTVSSLADDAFMLVAGVHSGFHSLDDLHGNRTMIVAGNAPDSEGVTSAKLLRSVLGLNLRVVSGYPGGQDTILAVKRGEADGRMISRSSMRVLGWTSAVPILSFFGRSIGVPSAMDLATTPEAKAVITLAQIPFKLWRPFAGPPDMAQASLLRRQFRDVVTSPSFQAEAKLVGVDVTPLLTDEVTANVRLLYGTPALVSDKRQKTLSR